MELRHLRYFVAVAELQNVRLASARLHVTQPAVSRQVHDLEDEVGVALFDRTPRGLQLTQAGRVFLIDARKALALVEDAKRTARRIGAGQQGHLRLGLVESAGWDGLLPEAIGRFQRDAPDVSIELFPMLTPRQLQALADAELDGGVVYVFDRLPEDIELHALARHDVVLAVPAGAPPPATPAVRARDLNGQPFVIFQRAVYPAYYDRLLSACSQAGLTPNIVQEVGSEAAVLSLVSAGIGIAIVNNANLGRPPARVRFVPLADLSVPLPMSFARLRANTNPALERFLRALMP